MYDVVYIHVWDFEAITREGEKIVEQIHSLITRAHL